MVSICIPAYKSEVSLRRLLDSIIRQSYTDYEIIVSDDTPDSSLRSVIASYSGYPIKYYHNQDSLGSPANWNQAISYAKGEFIKIMHHDDWFADVFSLEKMVHAIEGSSAGMVFVQSQNIKDNQIVSTNAPSEEEIDKMKTHPFSLFFRNVIGAPSATLYKRNSIQYDHNLRWFVDVDYYSSLISMGTRIDCIAEPLICIGVSGPRVTNDYKDNMNLVAKEFMYSWYKKKDAGTLPFIESYFWLYKFMKSLSPSYYGDLRSYFRRSSFFCFFIIRVVLGIRRKVFNAVSSS